LALAHMRTGGLSEAEKLARTALGDALKSDLFREAALAYEYLGSIAGKKGSVSEALKYFLHVSHLIAKSPKAKDLRTELHLCLAQLWISQHETHHSAIHIKRGLENRYGSETEDVAELERCELEHLVVTGTPRRALKGLLELEERMREDGLGYQRLLTARCIASIASEIGDSAMASDWWSKTSLLAKLCGADRLVEIWKQESYSLTVPLDAPISSRLAAELPKVDLQSFGIITRSARIHEQGAWIGRVAPTTIPILIRGESGTGKELFARLAHALSDRKDHEFVALNCGALPSELLESELFGYRRGAFTGAISDKTGLFRSAHMGTIFLDEIGEMSNAAQTKLLRVLESGEFRPVGETRAQVVDVRVVAATNVDLERAVHKGTFRRDLYYRLKGLDISLPPLRERVNDIPVLSDYFLEQAGRALGKELVLPFETRQWLMGQPWRGNVRELKLSIERAAALAPASGSVREYHFSADTPQEKVSLDEELHHIERERVRNALEASEWNVTAAAELLRMSRTTLTGRLKKFDLKRPG